MSSSSHPSDLSLNRRRWSRPVILALVALTALGGAAWSIWLSAGDEVVRMLAEANQPARSAPAAPFVPSKPVDQPIEDDETAYWTEVAIFRAGPNRPRTVVVFRRARQAPVVNSNDGVSRGLLAREIVRQAVILAAREGFDVLVRDLAVGDPDEPGPADSTYRLGSFFQIKKQETPQHPQGGRITIVDGSGPGRKVVWHRRLDCMDFEFPNYARLVSQVEVLSRTDFRTLFRDWKLAPTSAPKPPVKPEELPQGVENRLVSLAETEQFAALRALHEAVRRDGGSPARWQALSRGYAMLGSLTEPLINASHAVFKARSLLYAQEAVVVENDSPRSLREQAFAEAMAGLYNPATSDLNLADKADGGKGLTPRTQATRAYLASDPDALGNLAAQSPDDPTPLYLQAIVRSRISGVSGGNQRTCRNEIITNLDLVLAKVPDCHRAIDAMCQASGVANLHRATTIDLEPFASTSATRLSAVPGLPSAVADRLVDGAEVDEFALRQSLVKASISDTNDLTWGALAQQLREIRFLQVCRRLHFLAYPLGSGASEFVEVARPMVADHPCHEFVELYSGLIDREPAIGLIDRLDFDDLEMKNFSLIQPISSIDKERSDQLWRRGVSQADWGVVPECERHAREVNDPRFRMSWANALLNLDPSSPVARAIIVEGDWSKAEPKIADWEREQPWNTVLIAAHGFHLLEAKQFAEAQARFEAALTRSPELWIFQGLVKTYRERGQIDLWIKAAEAMLEQPDQSLDHAETANDLARYLMDNGEVDRAWPWAERAAESWAGWAMITAWQCAEMRRDWKNAEAWVARASQRYGSQWLEWLIWCERTGRGNLKAASTVVLAQWDASRTAGSDDQAVLLANFGLMLDRADITRQISETRIEADPKSALDVMYLALACDRLGDTEARDKAFDWIATNRNTSAPKTTKMIATLIEWYRHRDTTKLDLAPVDALIAEIAPDNRPKSQTMVALFLTMFGRIAEALPYLKAADDATNAYGSRLMARHLLKTQGEPITEYLFNPPPPKSDPAVTPTPSKS